MQTHRLARIRESVEAKLRMAKEPDCTDRPPRSFANGPPGSEESGQWHNEGHHFEPFWLRKPAEWGRGPPSRSQIQNGTRWYNLNYQKSKVGKFWFAPPMGLRETISVPSWLKKKTNYNRAATQSRSDACAAIRALSAAMRSTAAYCCGLARGRLSTQSCSRS